MESQIRMLHIPQNAASQMLLNKGIEGALTARIMTQRYFVLEGRLTKLHPKGYGCHARPC
jgi:hypothetical protein